MTREESKNHPKEAAADRSGTEKWHRDQAKNAKTYLDRSVEPMIMRIAKAWRSWQPIEKFTFWIAVFSGLKGMSCENLQARAPVSNGPRIRARNRVRSAIRLGGGDNISRGGDSCQGK